MGFCAGIIVMKINFVNPAHADCKKTAEMLKEAYKKIEELENDKLNRKS